MPETRGVGRFYWHLQHYPRIQGFDRRPPLSEPADTVEYDHPCRLGRGRAYRFWPFRWALVAGLWRGAHDDDAVAPGGRKDIATSEEIGLW